MEYDRAVWQISGGPILRSFADVFLRFGVGLIGPGDAGPWSTNRDDNEFEGSFVRRFASELEIDDVLLLRSGISSITAVGLVASEYLYLNQFDDVNGWDLQHGRRVRWSRLPNGYDFGSSVFGAHAKRLSRVYKHEVVDYAGRFVNSPPTQWQSAALPSLPAEEQPLDDVPSQLKDMVALADDLAYLMWDGELFGEHPKEDELVAHFVVPFAQALGWPTELIAVKWRNIDVCLFRSLPRIPENVHIVIEVKRLGEGVEGALDQAKGYVKALGVPRDVVVSDGIRYRMYSSVRDFEHIAYANLIRLKQSAGQLFSLMKRS